MTNICQFCKQSNADDDKIGPETMCTCSRRTVPAVFNLELIISILERNVGVGNIIIVILGGEGTRNEFLDY